MRWPVRAVSPCWGLEAGHEAARRSRDLPKRVSRAYRSKRRHHNDPGGRAALGFTREAQPPRRVVVDPATIGTVISIFERYAIGAVSTIGWAVLPPRRGGPDTQ